MQVSKNSFFLSNKLKNVEFSREWSTVTWYFLQLIPTG